MITSLYNLNEQVKIKSRNIVGTIKNWRLRTACLYEYAIEIGEGKEEWFDESEIEKTK